MDMMNDSMTTLTGVPVTASMAHTTASMAQTTAGMAQTTGSMAADMTTAGKDWDSYEETLTADDATWVLISTFIIFTMQSGFGLLESGCVSAKNSINIMYKNASDVIFGGLMYWFLGYGFQFGDWPSSNSFIGIGRFCVDIENIKEMGDVFVTYVFQLSFACTATTIVSGAMAERVKLPSYIVYAALNPVFGYAIPAHWVWDSKGWLSNLGVVDIAGSGVVHLNGGAAALVAAAILGPRKDRYKHGSAAPPPGNGTNVILGTFMLWWGWLGFNCGSTFGVQDGMWKLAGKSAITTMNASMGGGLAGIIITLVTNKGHFGVADLCNGVLGGLVSITAPCAVVKPWESIVIGIIGGALAVGCSRLMDKLRIDDPVGAISVHGAGGIWGMLSVGLFMHDDSASGLNKGLTGAFYGGGGYSFGVQLAAVVSIMAWAMAFTAIVCLALKYTVGLRMTPEEEEVGADAFEHMMDQYDERNLVVVKGNDDKLQIRRRSMFGLTEPVVNMSQDNDDDDIEEEGAHYQRGPRKSIVKFSDPFDEKPKKSAMKKSALPVYIIEDDDQKEPNGLHDGTPTRL